MNKLDQRLNLSRAELKERFRQTTALRSVLDKGGEFDFFDVSYDAIREVFGKIEKTDFDGISSMAPFFASKHNIILDIIKEHHRRG